MNKVFSVLLTGFTLNAFSLPHTVEAVPLPVKKSVDTQNAVNKLAKKVKDTAPKAPLQVSLKEELSALNEVKLSVQEKKIVNQTIKAIFKNKKSQALGLIKKITDPTAKKLVQWYGYRHSKMLFDYDELSEFLSSNPKWPSRSRLVKKIEVSLYKGALPPEKIDAYFQKNKAQSLVGKTTHADALFKLGKKKEATELVRSVWHNPHLPSYLEKFILATYPLMLRPEDHKIRIDRLLYQGKKSKATAAIRTAKKVGSETEKAARFRAAVVKRQFRHARRLFPKLGDKTKSWPGVHLARIELARRSKKYDHAMKLMVASNYKADEILNKDKWWVERRKLTREAISQNKYEIAYKIASGHRGPSVNKYNEAEFLSGWLALQYLKKPKVAEKHFDNFKKAADGPRTRSKSAYWMGRTQQVLKNEKAKAIRFSTLEAICKYLNCQPGDIIEYKQDNN